MEVNIKFGEYQEEKEKWGINLKAIIAVIITTNKNEQKKGH